MEKLEVHCQIAIKFKTNQFLKKEYLVILICCRCKRINIIIKRFMIFKKILIDQVWIIRHLYPNNITIWIKITIILINNIKK
jgi:hypothetical protein